LREVLDAIALPVNVELKARGGDGLEARALDVVVEAGARNRVVFSSFHPESLVRLRQRSPDAAIAVLSSQRRLARALRLAGRVGATALHIRNGAVVPGEVRAARARGLEVRVWTVNEPGESAALATLGVSGFESSANFIEEQKPGVFPKTLHNMWLAVMVFNPLISLLSLGLLPLPS
jgi:glycerophosphoryl diester phosphodiesterase